MKTYKLVLKLQKYSKVVCYNARTVHHRLRDSISDASNAHSRLVSVTEFLIIVGSVLVLSLSVVIVCVGVVKLCKRYETNQ